MAKLVDPEMQDPKSLLASTTLMSMKAASPIYRAETRGLEREIARREAAGLEFGAYQTRLALSQARLTLYSAEIALARKVGPIPEGAMVVYGVVTKQGAPVRGLVVAGYDIEGQPLEPAVTTDTEGSFVLTVHKPAAARIVVSTSDLKVLHCHPATFEFEAGKSHRVKIDLLSVEPVAVNPVYPCSADTDDDENVVTVPDLKGLTPDAAAAALKASKLTGTYDSAESDAPLGTVIAQAPDAGTKVQVQSSVKVTLAKPRTARVPNVVEKTEKAARAALEPAFQVEVHATRDGMEPGRVVRQIPAAESTVELPATVTLLVTRQADETTELEVPDVVGSTHEAAQETLRHAGFALGSVQLRFADGPVGTVLIQEPKGGTSRPQGSAVALTLAIPKQRDPVEGVLLPDVVGLLEKEALSAITKAGFDPPSVTRRPGREKAGTVITQLPPGNRKYTPDTKLTLVVAKQRGGAIDPDDEPRD